MRLFDLSLVNTVAAVLAGTAGDGGSAQALRVLDEHGVQACLYARDEHVFRPVAGGEAIAAVSEVGRMLVLGQAAGAVVPLRDGDETVGALELERPEELGRDLCGALQGVFALAVAKGRRPPPQAGVGREAALVDAVLDSVGDVTDEHERGLLTEHFLEELFETLPTAIAVTDPATREVVSVNQAFLDLIGRESSHVIGARAPFPWYAPSSEGLGVDQALADGLVRSEGLVRHADGRLVPVEIVRTLIRDADGAPHRAVDLVTDLSERRTFAQQLMQSGKLAAIGELAAGVAHEINNPLFAILGLVEFLLKEAEPGTKAHSRLTLIQETGLEIKEIVRSLLDFARERSDEFRIVALNDVVAQAAGLLRRTSAAKRVELVERYPDEQLSVDGSPSQLKQILLNLVTNARQAMPDGGTITLTVERRGGDAALTIRDTGPGIPPDDLPRVFDPFFTTKRDLGGTGLGLSVSLGIAQMHGGDLVVDSTLGEGSTFTLTLPLEEGDA